MRDARQRLLATHQIWYFRASCVALVAVGAVPSLGAALDAPDSRNSAALASVLLEAQARHDRETCPQPWYAVAHLHAA